MRLDPHVHVADDRAGALLDRARLAAGAFATLDRDATLGIARVALSLPLWQG